MDVVDDKGVHRARLPGAVCQPQVVNDRVFWKEAPPSVKIQSTDLKTGLTETLAEGESFSISPDGETLLVGQYIRILKIDLGTKKVTTLYADPEGQKIFGEDWPRNGYEYWFNFLGWSKTRDVFWFIREGTDGYREHYTASVDKHTILETSFPRCLDCEETFNVEWGLEASSTYRKNESSSGEELPEELMKETEREWNSGKEIELTVVDPLSGRSVLIGTSHGQPFHPRWNDGNLKYDLEGETKLISLEEIRSRLK